MTSLCNHLLVRYISCKPNDLPLKEDNLICYNDCSTTNVLTNEQGIGVILVEQKIIMQVNFCDCCTFYQLKEMAIEKQLPLSYDLHRMIPMRVSVVLSMIH